ncbi:MAG TPA: MurR/RpiR family transcriptional regulator [Paenalcaligenes sp.]|nr:MurR/RpiR family transcriptional regulator [Paenalcaligenes sp.]
MVKSPPTTLEALHELFLHIQAQPDEFRLGEKSMASLHGLLTHPKDAAHGSITELAVQFDVSPATLTRLSRRLGFESFNQFQELFKNSLSTRQAPFYSTQASRLLEPRLHRLNANRSTSPSHQASQRLEQLAHENINNIHGFMQQLNNKQFQLAAQAIAQAGQVRIHGKRQYSALAQFLCYGLTLIRPYVGLLEPNNLGLAEGLAQLQPDDVLITASVNPYTREVVQIGQQAAAQGVTLISLTDHTLSPLAESASFAFAIPVQSSFYSNSISAYFVFAEGLLNQVAWELGPQAIESIKNVETQIQNLKIETLY